MKTILKSILPLVIGLMFFGCNSPTDAELLVGNWERMETDTINRLIEFTEDGNWLYFKDGEMVEEGTFVLENQKMVMKHKVEEHSHEAGHAHLHPEDHIYEYSFANDNSELHLQMGEKTISHKRQ